MCEAICKPAGVTIHRRHLALAWQQNPDGAGFAWREADNSVHYSRGYFDFRQFWKAYREHDKKDMLIHLRLATHGKKCLENCHPFVVDDNVAMAHNGIMHEFTGDTKGRSDSRAFVEDALIPSVEAAGGWDAFWSPAVEALLSRVIGYSKLLFLTSKGFVIVNEAMGEWSEKTGDGGRVWWSSGVPTEHGAYGWADEDSGYQYMYGAHSVAIQGSYAEASQEWLIFLQTKYGKDNVQMAYGMPLGSLVDQAEFRGKVTPAQIAESLDRLDRGVGGQSAAQVNYLNPNPKITVFDPKTGAPIPTSAGEWVAMEQQGQLMSPNTVKAMVLAKRTPMPEWVTTMAPVDILAPITVDRFEDMLERGLQPEDIKDILMDEQLPARFSMSDDEVIDTYLRNKVGE